MSYRCGYLRDRVFVGPGHVAPATWSSGVSQRDVYSPTEKRWKGVTWDEFVTREKTRAVMEAFSGTWSVLGTIALAWTSRSRHSIRKQILTI
ncbi:hypothetical protein BDM02DRAFT_3114263 [Thelephora ganbajun]|uniref:Uncharacterized protein n=1 Tax=Thelephora ganbajun TaxID=370292 RepID=A0ACB6ZI55_THEGA|nr:hypothetical protein BDM02DRAFT_3114263 [Thelephora ganbajun]